MAPPIIWLGGHNVFGPQYFALKFKILTLGLMQREENTASCIKIRLKIVCVFFTYVQLQGGFAPPLTLRQGALPLDPAGGKPPDPHYRPASWSPNNFYVAPPTVIFRNRLVGYAVTVTPRGNVKVSVATFLRENIVIRPQRLRSFTGTALMCNLNNLCKFLLSHVSLRLVTLKRDFCAFFCSGINHTLKV